jgi:ornithine cyclodeaminase/alanine dehydrogenase-like protein (mu-crystallin family)
METLLLARKDVAALLSVDESIAAVENAFRLLAEGRAMPPKVLGIYTKKGGFHIKAGVLDLNRNYFVVKINSNFQHNTKELGLPLIQGVVAVYDGDNGCVLALMDSIEITILRTGAATAVAAKYLALPDADAVTICGCGNQGAISLRSILKVRPIKKVYAFDTDVSRAEKFAETLGKELNLSIVVIPEPGEGVIKSKICITCTPSKRAFLKAGYIMPGTFIAAVGSDSEEKQELDPRLVSSNKLVTDLTEQCANIGELHHAIENKLMTAADVYAEIGEIISGKKPGRTSDEEIIIFDSTGTALQDVATAAIVYEKAVVNKTRPGLNFAE